MRRRIKGWQLAVGLILVVVTAWGLRLLLWPGPPADSNDVFARRPPDPRLTYKGPFQNVHPDIKCVGDAVCAKCHADVAASYRDHPMGRSLTSVANEPNPPPRDKKHHNPFTAFATLFRVDKQGERLWHTMTTLDAAEQPLAELALEVHFAIGSGNHGRSYLINRDGYLFLSPIAWYSRQNTWNLAPGLVAPDQLSGRPALPDCLFCHVNRAEHWPGSFNRYQPPIFSGHAIGCERCHGPGELHVARGGLQDPQANIDYTIVNPRHLATPLKEAVCEQCHLAGVHREVHFGQGLYDFRPALPLAEFWSVLVEADRVGQERKVVNHVEQMYLSSCYTKSTGQGKLQCVSCHNPHHKPAAEQRIGYFRGKCLACHGQADQPGTGSHGPHCALPVEQRTLQNKQDSCIDCHMPNYPLAEVAHVAFTDHRILRQPPKKPVASSSAGPLNLIHFHSKKLDLNDPAVARHYAIALVLMANSKIPRAERCLEALPLLDEALARYPGDWLAWENKGLALKEIGQFQKALATFEALLAQQPQREVALVGAALCAQQVGDQDLAFSYWQRVVAGSPWVSHYRANLAVLAALKDDWALARVHGKVWLELDPASVDARKMHVACLLHEGKLDRAKAEFAKVRTLQPPNLSQLEQWFAQELAKMKGEK